MKRWLVAAALLLLQACRHEVAPPAVHILRAVHRDPAAPLVVALHGRGGAPERFASMWPGADYDLAAPRGPTPWGNGFGWFDWPPGISEEELAKRVVAAADQVWPAIAETAAGRKVVVIGFSQGAVVAFALAARHPEAVVEAIPIAGTAPKQILLADRPPAPVYALHGTDDRVIPISFARAAIAAFRAHGGVAELHEIPGIDHTITAEMRAEVLARVRAAVR